MSGPSPDLPAIVLAAGQGSRFGGRKLLAPWKGGVLIDAALASAFTSGNGPIVLVTGSDAQEIAAAAERFANAAGQPERLLVAHAADHGTGMAASLATGLRALAADAAGAFVFLADMPRLPAEVPDRLRERFSRDVDAVVPVHAGRRGHPVLIGARLFSRLSALTGDVGARGVLSAPGTRLAEVEVADPGILVDIDTPDDLRRAQAETAFSG